MRRLASLALLCLAASCGLWGGDDRLPDVTNAPGTAEHAITVGDVSRTFLLHVPPHRPRRLGRAAPYALLVVLHGSGADGETVRRMSGLDALADSGRFLVAYPNGTAGLLGFQSDWNAGECCGAAAKNRVDDVGFVRALVASVSARMPVDAKRVYVAGFSDGARMSYRVACELGDQVAAIGVVSGSLVDAHCTPSRPVPLVGFHGTADEDVSYNDSSLTVTHAFMPVAAVGLPPSVRTWAAMNGCRNTTRRTLTPHVTRAEFHRCNADVEFYTIADGGHAWPGGVQDGDKGAEPTPEISASREMLSFFLRHPQR